MPARNNIPNFVLFCVLWFGGRADELMMGSSAVEVGLDLLKIKGPS